jgi:tetratricopeptide (TPR) repeat protein
MSRKPHVGQLHTTLASDPHSTVFAQLADAYRKEGNFEEAIRVCTEGLRRRPKYAAAYIVLGRAHHESGDLPAAREAFQRVTQLAPDNVLAYGFLGQIAEAQNEIPQALDAYRIALTLYPFDKQIRAAIARLEAQAARETPSASPALAEARAVPKEPLASETLAELYASQGLYERAAQTYERVISDAPERADLHTKYREVTAHLTRDAKPGVSSSAASGDALRLLEAWRDAFRRLKEGQRTGTEMLEAWQTAFQRLRAKPTGAIGVLEAWRDAFRRVKAAMGREAT